MDAAQNAVNNFFKSDSDPSSDTNQKETSTNGAAAEMTSTSKTGEETTTMDQTVAPAVEHETVKKEHELREETVTEKERHKDHYHTTVQPLKDREVQPEEHDYEEAATQYKDIEHGDPDAVKSKVDGQNAGFESTTEEAATEETKTKETTTSGDNIHHHYHETVQPVIEKETVKPSVTHKTIPVKETHHEEAKDHGVTTAPTMSVDDFKHKLDGEPTTQKGEFEGDPVTHRPAYDGAPE